MIQYSIIIHLLDREIVFSSRLIAISNQFIILFPSQSEFAIMSHFRRQKTTIKLSFFRLVFLDPPYSVLQNHYPLPRFHIFNDIQQLSLVNLLDSLTIRNLTIISIIISINLFLFILFIFAHNTIPNIIINTDIFILDTMFLITIIANLLIPSTNLYFFDRFLFILGFLELLLIKTKVHFVDMGWQFVSF